MHSTEFCRYVYGYKVIEVLCVFCKGNEDVTKEEWNHK